MSNVDYRTAANYVGVFPTVWVFIDTRMGLPAAITTAHPQGAQWNHGQQAQT